MGIWENEAMLKTGQIGDIGKIVKIYNIGEIGKMRIFNDEVNIRIKE